jgi:hypothetical protein
MRLRRVILWRVKYTRIKYRAGNKIETVASTGKMGGRNDVSDVSADFFETGHLLLGEFP